VNLESKKEKKKKEREKERERQILINNTRNKLNAEFAPLDTKQDPTQCKMKIYMYKTAILIVIL
jgi:hypothetical protein